MSRQSGGLEATFADHLAGLGAGGAGDTVLVALSGGLDSNVLLHLLLHVAGRPARKVTAAHLDHAMRDGSAADAAWVRGLARAWGVRLVEDRLPRPPADEAEARRQRYDFLREARRRAGARWIVTAHHADDQAETVLFRALRGTGLAGLGGIRSVREEARLLRPLLPWWRDELEAYAHRHRVPWRVDPTNEDRGYARNVLRHDILPLVEERVAPGARRALVRLARLAREDEAGWEAVVADALDRIVAEASEDRIVVNRPALLACHPTVRARALRTLVRRFGPTLDEAGTRAALQFTSSGASGRELTLPDGVTLGRDFDRLVLSTGGSPEVPPGGPGDTGRPEASAGAAIHIREAGSGEGRLVLGGRSWLVRWSRSERPPGRWVERFNPSDTAFPLRLRGWTPGDRAVLPYGSKKVVKLFAEARVPAAERRVRPVVEDGRGRIVWIPGVVRAAPASEAPDGAREGSRRDEDDEEEDDEDDAALIITIADADD